MMMMIKTKKKKNNNKEKKQVHQHRYHRMKIDQNICFEKSFDDQYSHEEDLKKKREKSRRKSSPTEKNFKN
jgi:hypothetical protein